MISGHYQVVTSIRDTILPRWLAKPQRPLMFVVDGGAGGEGVAYLQVRPSDMAGATR